MCVVGVIVMPVQGQTKKRFEQESLLKPCEIVLPLYYATKKQKALLESVEKYKDVEIVLLTIEKGKPSYKSYYLDEFESKYGKSAYLVEPEYRNQQPHPKKALFLDYKPKKHIFYDDKCFRENPVSRDIPMSNAFF